MVVGLTTDVFVGIRDNGRWFFRLDLVEFGIEDVLDAFVGVNTGWQSPAASSFQTILAVAVAEPQQAQAGAIGLLRMFAGGQKRLHDLGCVGANGLSPANDPFW